MRRVVILFCLLSGLASALLADQERVSIHLANGRGVSGKILDFDEARGITIERDDNGGKLPLQWHQIRGKDVEYIKRLYGFVGDEMPPIQIQAVKVTTKTGTMIGIEEGVKDGRLHVRRREIVIPIPLETIIRPPETVMVDALELEAAPQVFDRKKAESPPVRPVDWYNLGLLAESLFLYEQARNCFETCLDLNPDFSKAAVIKRKTGDFAVREKEKEQSEALRQIQSLRYRGSYRDAMARVVKFEETWPGSSLLGDVQREKKRIASGQKSSILGSIRTDFFTYLRRACEARGRNRALDEDGNPVVGLGEAMTWAQEECLGEVRTKLMTLYGLEKEEDFTSLWETRGSSGSPISASYGGGTFILREKATEGYGRAPKEEEEEQKSSDTSGDSNDLADRIAEKLKEKKEQRAKKREDKKVIGDIADVPPSPEDWWKGAQSKVRTSFLMAFFAENSGAVNVITLRKRDCSYCYGKGIIEFFGVPGSDNEGMVACPRCKTLRFDRIAVFK